MGQWHRQWWEAQVRLAQQAQLLPAAVWLRQELRPALRREVPVAPQQARAWPPLLRLVERRLALASAVRARSVV